AVSDLEDRGTGDRSPRWLPEFAHPVESPRPGPPPKRVRVVLAERKRARRVVRTLAEVEEQTGVGEQLVRRLIREQLGVSLWLTLLLAATVGALPAVFYYVDELGRASVLGIRLPWLVLGAAVYPFLLLLGWVYVRLAERTEQGFVNIVED
ncbi:MAG: hypothetical protein ACRDSN_21470, partial [Pseudonocardiaceae bacterium]